MCCEVYTKASTLLREPASVDKGTSTTKRHLHAPCPAAIGSRGVFGGAVRHAERMESRQPAVVVPRQTRRPPHRADDPLAAMVQPRRVGDDERAAGEWQGQ
eukprot:CAMPEP_0195582996 /NCGR_PEP_ID=MMETSP0814-20130614/23298_1 /TAXON_ID=97485 /ORGANISM="Prymnesium parvum, Strain Texoma1" /LENGTH=100 /DNA_ID=CAMNT_0040720717 /DNA_START=128 /DNA_END=427 /DNA_ORIENTATION=+